MNAGGTGSAADFLPPVSTLPALRKAAAGCRGCGLYRNATQTVFGEGHAPAGLMLVGEQPGDQEDRAGQPFVGPSGRLLDEALAEVGIDRGTTYVTNAVKHFKFVRQELIRRRLHKKPTAGEVRACRPWLEEEIKLVRPALIVALGSTAAQALLGPAFRVTRERGRVIESANGPVLATVHPSAILRAPGETRAAEQRAFVHDLAEAARWLARSRPRRPSPPARPTRRSRTRPTA
jgi:uracil-DNA glycosylase family protein